MASTARFQDGLLDKMMDKIKWILYYLHMCTLNLSAGCVWFRCFISIFSQTIDLKCSDVLQLSDCFVFIKCKQNQNLLKSSWYHVHCSKKGWIWLLFQGMFAQFVPILNWNDKYFARWVTLIFWILLSQCYLWMCNLNNILLLSTDYYF